jgi:hypothetical protein
MKPNTHVTIDTDGETVRAAGSFAHCFTYWHPGRSIALVGRSRIVVPATTTEWREVDLAEILRAALP